MIARHAHHGCSWLNEAAGGRLCCCTFLLYSLTFKCQGSLGMLFFRPYMVPFISMPLQAKLGP
jgi:hypothetical protein